MQIGQLHSHLGQTHLARSELMTGAAAELLETFSPLALRGRALIRRNLGDDAHRLQRGDASFKPLCPLLTLFREAELALLPEGVAILTTVSVKKVLGEFALAFPGADHAVQRRGRGLRRSWRGDDAAAKQNDIQIFHNLPR